MCQFCRINPNAAPRLLRYCSAPDLFVHCASFRHRVLYPWDGSPAYGRVLAHSSGFNLFDHEQEESFLGQR